MAYKVKNTTRRRLGVNTPGGIRTIAPGKSDEFDEILNLDAVKAVAKVTGEKTEPKQDQAPASEPAAPAGAKPAGNKPAAPASAPPAPAKG